MAKALANRLQKVSGHLICEDQVGYIKGRYFGEAIRTIEDIILLTKEQNTPGFITLIDFGKAFDSIEWLFLFKCLEKFNSGPVFTSWIHILYTNRKNRVWETMDIIQKYLKFPDLLDKAAPLSFTLYFSCRNPSRFNTGNKENQRYKIPKL